MLRHKQKSQETPVGLLMLRVELLGSNILNPITLVSLVVGLLMFSTLTPSTSTLTPTTHNIILYSCLDLESRPYQFL